MTQEHKQELEYMRPAGIARRAEESPVIPSRIGLIREGL